MSRAGFWTTDPPQAYQSVVAALRSATPALLFVNQSFFTAWDARDSQGAPRKALRPRER